MSSNKAKFSCKFMCIRGAVLVALLCWMPVSADERAPATEGFPQVYDILKNNCGGCHVEGGTAILAWTLNTPATGRYEQCQSSPQPSVCTTYIKLTESEWPWIVPGSLSESQPYVNACDKENSYHIGVSIPKALSDADCAVIKAWILDGAKFEQP